MDNDLPELTAEQEVRCEVLVELYADRSEWNEWASTFRAMQEGIRIGRESAAPQGDVELPPLPKRYDTISRGPGDPRRWVDAYTAEQMNEHARAAVALNWRKWEAKFRDLEKQVTAHDDEIDELEQLAAALNRRPVAEHCGHCEILHAEIEAMEKNACDHFDQIAAYDAARTSPATSEPVMPAEFADTGMSLKRCIDSVLMTQTGEHCWVDRRFLQAVADQAEPVMPVAPSGDDKARLDWIEKHWFYKSTYEDDGSLKFCFNETWDAGKHDSLRAAIDAERNLT